MATIQNLKNFIRHGKQARVANAEPTTNISNVHAQQQRYDQYGSPTRDQRHHGISEPGREAHKPLQDPAVHGDFSVGAVDNRNIAAKAGDVAARAAEEKQKKQQAKDAALDAQVFERIVAEERESKGKLPRYPGLERFTLVEKMGDGAFSNVYRAKDNTGQFGEVAIKVVRKFEMNASQVCLLFQLVRLRAFAFVAPRTPFRHSLTKRLPQALSNHSNDVGR
jgi:hypothetical protein